MSEVRRVLAWQALTRAAFAPFGDVVDAAGAQRRYPINDGTAERFDCDARVDTAADHGRTQVALVRARPRALPFAVERVERHALGSQLFMPLSGRRYLVIVATAGAPPHVAALHGFVCRGDQGINYEPGTWHHALLALDGPSDFLVVDRLPPEEAVDCDEHAFEGERIWVRAEDVDAVSGQAAFARTMMRP